MKNQLSNLPAVTNYVTLESKLAVIKSAFATIKSALSDISDYDVYLDSLLLTNCENGLNRKKGYELTKYFDDASLFIEMNILDYVYKSFQIINQEKELNNSYLELNIDIFKIKTIIIDAINFYSKDEIKTDAGNKIIDVFNSLLDKLNIFNTDSYIETNIYKLSKTDAENIYMLKYELPLDKNLTIKDSALSENEKFALLNQLFLLLNTNDLLLEYDAETGIYEITFYNKSTKLKYCFGYFNDVARIDKSERNEIYFKINN